MGILDLNNPQNMGLLSLGLRLMSTPGKFGTALGQAGMGALGDMQQIQAQNDTRKSRELQQQMLMMQLEQAKALQEAQRAQAEKAKALEAAYSGAIVSPAQQALAGGGGPTIANAQAMQGMQPKIDQNRLIQGLLQAGAGPEAYALLQPKAPIKAGEGDVFLDPATYKPIASIPKTPTKPGAVQEFEYGLQNPAFNQWDQARRKSGATNLSVNTGQRGLDNTLKLRGDFRQEPIYKAFQEVQSAHSQITTALKQASPAGDLAGATKLMKILDPGSVVRESELGMAMAAGGLLDRIENYASLVLKGEKLTPAQRADFQKLADSLFAESERQYNAKRSEYEGIAKRNSLDVMDVLGPASSYKPRSDGWGITPVEDK